MSSESTTKRSLFWTINAGHVITLIGYILAGVYFMGSLSTNFEQLANKQVETQQKIGDLVNRLESLEKEGSLEFKSTKVQNDKVLNNHELRILKLEDVNSTVLVKISSLDSRLDSVGKDVNTIKELALRGNLRIYPNEPIK